MFINHIFKISLQANVYQYILYLLIYITLTDNAKNSFEGAMAFFISLAYAIWP